MIIYSIYKITNNINQKIYIGFTENLQKRILKHKCMPQDRLRLDRIFLLIIFTQAQNNLKQLLKIF